MTAPDYMPEPEDTRAAAAVKKAKFLEAKRSIGSSGAVTALVTSRGANPDFHDPAALLEFERTHPDAAVGGSKEAAIRDRFNVRAARYYSRLYQLIHDDEATARRIDAITVNRLLRLEAEHQETRRRRTEGYTPA